MNQKINHLNIADAIGIGFSWGGAGVVAYVSGDPLVGIIAIIAAYYLAKMIILKKED
jgi:hypothetical protein